MNEYEKELKMISKVLEYECYENITELVERATPKKMLSFTANGNKELCGNCENYIPHKDFKFCPYCGRKLDWSDE